MSDFKKLLNTIKNHEGLLNQKTNPENRTKIAVAGLIFSLILILVPGWILFIKLQFLQAPGLMYYFPGVYAALWLGLLLGIYILIKSLIKFKK